MKIKNFILTLIYIIILIPLTILIVIGSIVAVPLCIIEGVFSINKKQEPETFDEYLQDQIQKIKANSSDKNISIQILD